MPHTSPFSSAMPHAGQPQGPLARDLFAQLRRRFEPMLSLAVAHASADGERDYEKLSGIMAQLCDKEEREPSVLAQNQLEACRLAAYALVDEILLGLPQSGWFAHGLQLQRLGRTDGGNAFYAALFAMLTEALETESSPPASENASRLNVSSAPPPEPLAPVRARAPARGAALFLVPVMTLRRPP